MSIDVTVEYKGWVIKAARTNLMRAINDGHPFCAMKKNDAFGSGISGQSVEQVKEAIDKILQQGVRT